MSNKFLAVLTVSLLAGPLVANADPVQSSTGVYLTFRPCIAGETICDSIGPPQAGRRGGLPGASSAATSFADPAYGEASGSAQLKGAPGTAELSANVTSMPGTRNGANSVTMQRYTNTSENAQTLTVTASLTYDQTIPAENADFPAGGPTISGANAEIIIFSLDADSLNAGTTAEENNSLLLEGPDPDIVTTEPAVTGSKPFSNITASGTETLSSTVTVQPGDSVWLWVILQSLVANGAEVSATMNTTLESTKAD